MGTQHDPTTAVLGGLAAAQDLVATLTEAGHASSWAGAGQAGIEVHLDGGSARAAAEALRLAPTRVRHYSAVECPGNPFSIVDVPWGGHTATIYGRYDSLAVVVDADTGERLTGELAREEADLIATHVTYRNLRVEAVA